MTIRHHVKGYNDFVKFFENLKTEEPVFVLYTGAKLENGQSWCPDCVEAEPFIEAGLKTLPEKSHFVEVQVGDRAFWKDPNCIFRKDNKTQLKVLPTLALWGTQKRLQGSECQSEVLLDMLFTEKDD
ncbi:thioredoxin domain-containing protein 17-like [Polistes fuscatus]|uniref:thioredoxin domain-containing protein 17-like n=1 Tax=Polistes fuscatus TaxID=30207 RepID=UPI001CA9D6A2|nr:thioredoxin domain-containing protein 17-like [Polistes fuscatus]